MVYSTPLPWGGTGISLSDYRELRSARGQEEIHGAWRVFLQYGPDAKIHRIRLIVGEIEEVQQLFAPAVAARKRQNGAAYRGLRH